MLKYKFFEVYFSLSKKEKQQYYALINAQFFPRSNEVKNFITFLINGNINILNTESEKLILDNHSLSDLNFRRILNYSLNSVLSFVSFIEIESNTFNKHAFLAKYFRKHRLQKNFNSLINKVSDPGKELDEFYSQHIIETEFQSYELLINRTSEGKQQTLNLDAYFVLSKLKLACNGLMSKRMSNQDINISFLPEILKSLKKNQALLGFPLIHVYHIIYTMLLNNKVEDYERVKAFLTNETFEFSQAELRDIYTYALNFCIRQMNAGHTLFATETFDLYKISLDSKALYVEGKLSPFTYKNVVSLGIKTAAFDWTQKFIEDYKKDLPAINQESFYAFNLSRLFFSRNNFNECVELLQKATIKDPLTAMACRVIEIKAFYELDELELLDSLIKNLNQLVRRKAVLAYHKESYRNFGLLLRKLTRINFHDKAKLKKLHTEIIATQEIVEKPWLLEKIPSL